MSATRLEASKASIPLLIVCALCGRPSHLWGGASCDVCDKDNNGVNDVDEPIALATVDPRLLLPPDERGFAVQSGCVRYFVVAGWENLSSKFKDHVIAVFRKRRWRKENRENKSRN